MADASPEKQDAPDAPGPAPCRDMAGAVRVRTQDGTKRFEVCLRTASGSWEWLPLGGRSA